MDYAAVAKVAMKYGRQFGPRALTAWSALAQLVDKNPQLGKLSDQMSRRLATRRPGSRINGQIEMAKEFATDALTDQSLPERQDLARSWTQKAKGLDMQLRAAEGGLRGGKDSTCIGSAAG